MRRRLASFLASRRERRDPAGANDGPPVLSSDDDLLAPKAVSCDLAACSATTAADECLEEAACDVDNECCICLVDMAERQMRAKMDCCDHVVCWPCHQEWSRTSHSRQCPICQRAYRRCKRVVHKRPRRRRETTQGPASSKKKERSLWAMVSDSVALRRRFATANSAQPVYASSPDVPALRDNSSGDSHSSRSRSSSHRSSASSGSHTPANASPRRDHDGAHASIGSSASSVAVAAAAAAAAAEHDDVRHSSHDLHSNGHFSDLRPSAERRRSSTDGEGGAGSSSDAELRAESPRRQASGSVEDEGEVTEESASAVLVDVPLHGEEDAAALE